MTREDIECIIKWFSHIEQLATDGKTANGFQMHTDKLLATIKVVAKDSREYVEKFCNESVPADLEEAAKEYAKTIFKKPYSDNPDEEVTIVEPDKYAGFIAGAEWQEEKDIAEMVQSRSPLSVAYANRCFENGKQAMKEQMMKEAVEGRVFMSFAPGHNQMIMADVDLPTNTSVRVIVLPKED